MSLQSVFNQEQQEQIRQVLQQKREIIMQTQAGYQAELRPERRKDFPDLGNEEMKSAIASHLVYHEMRELREIEAALSRLNDGTYGICSDCGSSIPQKRLDVLPYARFCLSCTKERQQMSQVS